MSKHINARIGLAYLENRLDAAQRAKVERHLADCASCRRQLQQHQASHHLLQTAAQDFAPQPRTMPSWPAVRRRYEKRQAVGTMRQTGLRLAAAGLTVLFVVFVAVWYLPLSGNVEPAASAVPPTMAPTAEPPTTVPVLPPATDLPALPLPEITPIPDASPVAAPAQQASPSPTADPLVGAQLSLPILNAQGQVAFVQDGVLYAETGVGSGKFTAVARQVAPEIQGEDGPVANPPAAWSPDGRQLLFFYRDGGSDSLAYQVGIWSAASGELTTLQQWVERPLPTIPFSSFRWSPEGDKILLTTSDRLTADSAWTSGVWVANLATGQWELVVEARELVNTAWLSNDVFLLQLRCGANCAIVMAYNEQRHLLWKAYAEQEEVAVMSALFSLRPDHHTLLHLNSFGPVRTVDLLDTTSGEISAIWELAAGTYFAAADPQLSPDGRYILFDVVTERETGTTALHLIDRNGRLYGQRENGRFLDWRPGGGPVIVQAMAGDKQQLVYWPLDGAAARVFVKPRNFNFVSGKWSPDGRYFIYNALDESIGANYLYLWQPESGVPSLIHAAAATDPFQHFTWTPDAQHFYFNLGNQALWQYSVATEALTLIATTEDTP